MQWSGALDWLQSSVTLMLYVHIGCHVDVGAKATRLDNDGN